MRAEALVANRDAFSGFVAALRNCGADDPDVNVTMARSLARGDRSLRDAAMVLLDAERRVWEVEEAMAAEGCLGDGARTVVRRGNRLAFLAGGGQPITTVTETDPPRFDVFDPRD
jgi:hypothetical protein